jgi:hypothetical protein
VSAPTKKGKKYCDSVFSLMAFFPIVFRKVRGYVALHENKESAAGLVAGASARDSEVGVRIVA